MDHILLTPEETAELLRVAESDVIAMIEHGDLAALRVADQWRITIDSVKEFVTSGLRKQNAKALERALSDHSMWARILEEDPAFTHRIESGRFEANTMGAFLQEALSVSRAAKSGKVVPIRGHNDDGRDS